MRCLLGLDFQATIVAKTTQSRSHKTLEEENELTDTFIYWKTFSL